MYKSELFCPSCGNYDKRDLFSPAKEAMRAQGIGFWDTLMRSAGSRVNHYQCSACGYNGPLGPVMGIRLYLQRHGKAGRERLRRTILRQIAERAR